MKITAEVKYGDKIALDVDLELADGKSYALIGANGSGKSTLLKVIAGIIKNKNTKVEDNPSATLYMPQNSYGFSLSVRRNITSAYPFWHELAKNYKAEKTNIFQLFKQERENKKILTSNIIDNMELGKLAKKNGAKLSGGETQRVALARLFAAKGDLLLLDEPTASMDIKQALICEKALLEVKKTSQLIFSTHSVAQAEMLADEIIFLYEGKVAERLAAENFCLNVQKEETKQFLQYLYNIKNEDKQ